MKSAYFQVTLVFFCILLSITGCPNSIEVEDLNKNNLLPVGPNTQSEDVKDAGLREDGHDSGNGSANHETIIEPNLADAGNSEGTQTPAQSDSGVSPGTVIAPNTDAGGDPIIATPTVQDGGVSQTGLSDSGAPNANPDSWSEPDYTEGPSMPGSYVYERIAVGGLGVTEAVAIHPDASYALILQRTDIVHILDFSTMTTTRLDVGNFTFSDVRFHPNGESALLVGYQTNGSTTEGVLIHFKDQAWRAGQHTVGDLFEEVNDVPSSLKIKVFVFKRIQVSPPFFFLLEAVAAIVLRI